MAKIFINEKKKTGHINPEIYGHFASIWDAASMKGFMWAKIPTFPT